MISYNKKGAMKLFQKCLKSLSFFSKIHSTYFKTDQQIMRAWKKPETSILTIFNKIDVSIYIKKNEEKDYFHQNRHYVELCKEDTN